LRTTRTIVHTIMMTKDYIESYVSIEPYESKFDMTFEKLELKTSYWKGHGIVIHVQPVHFSEDGGKQYMMMCFDPVEDGLQVKCIPMARKNAKQIENVHKDLVGMGGIIADLWNKRDFEGIKALFS